METFSGAKRSKLPSSVPRRLRELLERCLARDPRQRVRDMGDVRLELEWIRAGKGGAPEPLTPDDAESPNYSPSGSWGDPTLATKEKGEALLEAMAEDVADMARRALASTRLN